MQREMTILFPNPKTPPQAPMSYVLKYMSCSTWSQTPPLHDLNSKSSNELEAERRQCISRSLDISSKCRSRHYGS